MSRWDYCPVCKAEATEYVDGSEIKCANCGDVHDESERVSSSFDDQMRELEDM